MEIKNLLLACPGLLVLLAQFAISPASGAGCVQGDNCKLPDCFCPTFTHPLLPVLDIPQIVYFGFDDAVQPQVSAYYDQLFTADRKNPNGCPITMTLYVSDAYTQYSKVQEYFKRGMEIASHSVTHTDIDTELKLRKEATEEKDNIVTEGKIPASKVTGWRSPNLKTAGDAQPRVLADLNYSYDISLPYSKDRATPWPFTLDHGFPYACSIPPCPGQDSRHPGFWEVMVRSFTDPATDLPCGYVDACRPEGEAAALEYLWSNFRLTYEDQRAPFGLNMHAAWFAFPEYLSAMEKFIDGLLDLSDVYIVNVNQMLEWMRTPVSLAEIKSFKPWGCGAGAASSPSKPSLSSLLSQQLKLPSRTGFQPIRPNNVQTHHHPSAAPAGFQSPVRNSESPSDHFNLLKPLPVSFQKWNQQRLSTTRAPTPVRTTMQPITAPNHLPGFWPNISPAGSKDGQGQVCVQGFNCHTPTCFCRTASPPLGLPSASIPQIVYLAIDSRVDSQTFVPLMQVFSGFRKNPNGCPISATVFVPTSGNNVLYSRVLKAKGVRMGIKAGDFVPLSSPDSVQQKVSLEVTRATNTANISSSFGWRGFASLFPTDDVFHALSERQARYDSSVMADAADLPWPYTLDFRLADRCSVLSSRCPKARYPGMWEVPIAPLRFTSPHQTCFFLDTCPGAATTEENVFRVLFNNFQVHYTRGRSPFGINLRREWLVGRNKLAFQRGLLRFFDLVLGQGDVFVVSIEQMLEWIVSPSTQAERFPC